MKILMTNTNNGETEDLYKPYKVLITDLNSGFEALQQIALNSRRDHTCVLGKEIEENADEEGFEWLKKFEDCDKRSVINLTTREIIYEFGDSRFDHDIYRYELLED